MTKMTQEDWKWAANSGFGPGEAWGDPYRMDKALVDGLIELRRGVRKINPAARIVIHCGYEPRISGGYHPIGMAVDCHATGIHLVELFLEAEKIDAFGGIGVYGCWNSPGLHLDTGARGRRWACFVPRDYVRIDRDVLKSLVYV